MEVLSCLLPSTFRKNGRDEQPSFSFFIFQTLQGITGVMIIIVMSIIYVFASQRSRRRQHRFGCPINYPFKNLTFRLFWTTHMLYPLFFFLLCIHGLQVFFAYKISWDLISNVRFALLIIFIIGNFTSSTILLCLWPAR